MSYNSVSTPRIYVDNLSYLQSAGVFVPEADAFGFSLATPYTHYDVVDNPTWLGGNFSNKVNIPYNFVAALGHRFGTALADASPALASVGFILKNDEVEVSRLDNFSESPGGVNIDYNYDGYSMWTFPRTYELYNEFLIRFGYTNPNGGDVQVGRIIAGSYFDFPHSPDLKLSLSYATGTKNTETKGGVSLSNNMWTVPKWGDMAAWELNSTEATASIPNLSHQSRKTWDITFSFLSKENTFPKYNTLNRLPGESIPPSGESAPEEVIAGYEYFNNNETLYDSEDFYSMVWNR